MAIILNLISTLAIATRCKSPYYPRVFGHTDGDFIVTFTTSKQTDTEIFAAGYTTSPTLSGSTTSKRAFTMILNSGTTALQSLQIYDETHFTSFVNGATNYDTYLVLITGTNDKTLKVGRSLDSGHSFDFYEPKHSDGTSLNIGAITGKLNLKDNRLSLCGVEGNTIKCIRLKLENMDIHSFSLKDDQGIYVDPKVMTMIEFDDNDVGVAFRWRDSANQYLHGFMRRDFYYHVTVFMTTLAPQAEKEDWYFGYSQSERNILAGTSEDGLTLQVYFWYQNNGWAIPSVMKRWNRVETSPQEVLFADYWGFGADRCGIFVRLGNNDHVYWEFYVNYLDPSASTSGDRRLIQGITEVSQVFTKTSNWYLHPTGGWGIHIFSYGSLRGHKDYGTRKVSSLNFIPSYSELKYCFQGYTGAVAYTTEALSWSNVSYQDGESIIEVDYQSYIKTSISVSSFSSTGTMNVEDPCDINLELTVPAAQTIYENYDGTWGGASCAQVGSYCDGTPSLTWTQPDSCFSLDTNSGTFTYDSCQLPAVLDSTLACTLANSGDPATSASLQQQVNLEENNFEILDCTPLTLEIHSVGEIIVSVDYSGRSDEDLSQIVFETTYDGQATISYGAETQTLGQLEIELAPDDCLVYQTHPDKTVDVWIRATDSKYGNQAECSLAVTLSDKSAPPYFIGPEISDQEYEVTQAELRILFTDGTDLDAPDEVTLVRHFSVDGVPWVDSATFGFIDLEQDGSGDYYLVVYTEDNAHSATLVMGTTIYNREYTIEYWLSDGSLCETLPASQISEVKQFTLTITPYNHEPRVIGDIAAIEVLVFETGVAALEIEMPELFDDDGPLDELTPYFRFASNQSDFTVNTWINNPSNDCNYEFLRIEGGVIKLQPCWNGMKIFMNEQIQLCVKDNNGVGQLDSSGASVIRSACGNSFSVTIIPLNHSPYFAEELKERQQFNRKEFKVELPQCLDSDPADIMSDSYTFTSLQLGNVASAPAFLTVEEPSNGKFILVFYPNEIQYVDEYEICVTCKDNNSEGERDPLDSLRDMSKSVKACFDYTVLGFNHPPEWKASLMDQEVKVGDSVTYYMPGYIDEDSLDIFTEDVYAVGLDALPDFLTFSSNRDGSGLKMEISPDLHDYVGNYTIIILVTDSDSEKSYKVEKLQGSFEINVFSDGAFQYDFEALNKRPTTSTQRPNPVIREISSTGLVWIQWEQDIFYHEELIYMIEEGAVTFEIESNYDDVEGQKVLIGFNITQLDESNIYVQLNFSDPYLIARFSVRLSLLLGLKGLLSCEL